MKVSSFHFVIQLRMCLCCGFYFHYYCAELSYAVVTINILYSSYFRRSREKAKQIAAETKERVEGLKTENVALEGTSFFAGIGALSAFERVFP